MLELFLLFLGSHLPFCSLLMQLQTILVQVLISHPDPLSPNKALRSPEHFIHRPQKRCWSCLCPEPAENLPKAQHCQSSAAAGLILARPLRLHNGHMPEQTGLLQDPTPWYPTSAENLRPPISEDLTAQGPPQQQYGR